MNHQRTPLAAALAAALLSMSVNASAQQASATPKATELDKVVVTGIRASLQQSIKQKRDSESLVEVVTAEDVGKMPDKNIADTLQRISGVTTTSSGAAEGAFGENEKVQLRSAATQLTMTTMNGHTVSTGDWYGPNIAAGGRSVTFTLLPSTLIGKVTVYKTSQADLVEGGAAGTVDFEARHPLDFSGGLTGTVSLEGGYSTASKKTDPQFSALLSYKNAENSLGVLGQVFYQKRSLRRAGSEGNWWDKVPDTYTGDTALRGKWYSRMSGAVLFEQERERVGGYAEVQFKPDANTLLELSGFVSELKASNTNTNYLGITSFPILNNMKPVDGSVKVEGDTITSIRFPAAQAGIDTTNWGSVAEDVGARPDAKTNSNFINFNAKRKINDSLQLSGKLGYTTGGGATTDVGFEAWNKYQGVGYNVPTTGGVLQILVPNGDKFVQADPGLKGAGWGNKSKNYDKEAYTQFDAEYQFKEGVFTSIKGGLRVTKHVRDLEKLKVTLAAGAADPGAISADKVVNYPSGWDGSLPEPVTPGYAPWQFPVTAVQEWVNKYVTFKEHDATSEYHIKEDTQAAYVLGNFAFGSATSGNVGVRVVRTGTDITAANASANSNNYTNASTEALPSLNLRSAFSKDWVGRFALSRAMSRPDFGQYAGADLRNEQHTATAGNPQLKSILSDNLDVATEWYFAPRSLLSLGVFYSKLDGVIDQSATTRQFLNTLNNQIEDYNTTLPVNSEGTLQGVQLSYEQAIGGGFGLNANYTYADGKYTRKDPMSSCNGTASENCDLIGTSKNSYNLGGYFENDSLSVRLSYSYRDAYKLGLTGGTPQYQKAFGTLGLAVNYNVTQNVTLTFEGQNINDPLMVAYKKPEQPLGNYRNGAIYYMGARLKF